jgi:formate dehydrogenase subunit gamma
LNSPFTSRIVGSIVVYSIVSGVCLAWLITLVITPMLATPFSFGSWADFPYQLDYAYLVNLFFQVLITFLILLAVVHNGLDIVSKAARRVVRREAGPRIRRFTLNQRIQHIWLFTTTAVLAVTGFAQLYYAGWGMYVINAMGGLAIGMDVHLLAAFLLGVLIVYHFGFYGAQYLARKARRLPAPLPINLGIRDIRDFLQNLKFMLGFSKNEPRYGKYDYAQKFDYWGIYWGMIILGAPGVIMWIWGYNFLGGLPFIFHTDEAMLAVLFLAVFHFYQTHWNPREFPMSKVYVSGTLSEEEMRDQHPLELERIKTEGGE